MIVSTECRKAAKPIVILVPCENAVARVIQARLPQNALWRVIKT